MMDEFIGAYGNNLIVAVVGVGAALLALAIILWIIRRRGGSSPFIRGGKNRQPRLQVLDATAVDARRRLVLVRRDNVEHLVMIGGPTDIVIESGIGAIPFMKDVQEPQNAMLETTAPEKAIAAERTRALAPSTETEMRTPMPAAPRAVAPQPEPRPARAPSPAPQPAPPVAARQTPAPVAPSAPAPAPRPAPSQAPAASIPAPAQPAPRPAPPAAQPVPDVSNAPRSFAREPASAPLTAAVVPAMIPAAVAAEPVARPKPPAPAVQEPPVVQAPAPTPSIESEPAFTAPVIDQNSAVDFLEAARERVLPTYRAEAPITATASPAKPAPLAPDENGAVFGDQLTSDFESFLEAEIARNNAAGAPAVTLEQLGGKIEPERVAPANTSSSTDENVQKEMARIFGEMSVTRDK
ncbi:flagellar biosynthetic protein FliO [Rhizobium skierniewicense]|uniref:flagellar biosynthetic protein FliO n=1 Tax=Rhizobium skierniewicense TaxID=984260 RepID=UPI0024338F5D|nr:flagellar biosynthetic protein FliO [Rhizobium skierniewicense]